jgi:hypothetical protein
VELIRALATDRELFCFKKPYLDQDPINLAYMVAHEELRPELLDHIPQILQRLMRRCWDVSPRQRPSFPAVITHLDEAKLVIQQDLAIDISRPYNDALAAHQRRTKMPVKPYGLTSGRI